MVKKNEIKIFDAKKVRSVWDSETEEWYFAVVDVVEILTDSADYQTARKYWKVLKMRLKKEGNETVTNCYQLKLLAADGKMRLTDVVTTQELLPSRRQRQATTCSHRKIKTNNGILQRGSARAKHHTSLLTSKLA